MTAEQPADTFPGWLALALVVLYGVAIDFSTDTPGLGPHMVHWGLPWPGHASQTTSAVNAAVLCGLALPMVVLRDQLNGVRRWSSWWGRAAGVLPALGAVLGFVWSRGVVPRGWGTMWNAMVVTVPVGLILLGALGRAAGWMAALALFSGTVVRLAHFEAMSIRVGADMLPLTDAALGQLFAGKSPYDTYMLPGPLPLTYYPLTWLAYAPARWLGIDLRWTNLAAEGAILGALSWLAARTTGGWRRGFRHPALMVWATLFGLPSAVYFDRITTAPIGWAVLAWTLALVVTRARSAWVAVGLLGGTTPLVAVFAPLIGVFWWRADGWRQAVLRASGAVALACAIVLPFYVWAPGAFMDGAVLWFNDLDRYPRSKWNAYQTWQRYVGFSGLLWRRGLEGWFKPLQVAAVAAVTALYARRPLAALPRHAMVAFTGFMVVNPVLWPYFYKPAVVAGLVALALLPLPRLIDPKASSRPMEPQLPQEREALRDL